MALLDQKLQKQVLLKMIQNSRRRQSLMLTLTLFLKSRRQLLIQLAFLTALLLFSRENTTTTTLYHRTCLLEVSICCTMEIYNEGSDIRRVQTRHIRIFIIFKTSAMAAMLEKTEIEADSYINFDYPLIMRLVRLI